MNLDAEQKAAVECEEDNVVIIAGPGSGKSTVLVERVRYMIRERNILPTTIALVTYTNAAAAELRKRLAEGGTEIGFCGTLHGLCLRLFSTQGDRVGLPKDVTVIDADAAGRLLDECVQRLAYKGTQKEIKECLSKGPCNMPRLITESAAAPMPDIIAMAYWAELQRSGALDYDGILHYGKLLAQRLSAESCPFAHLLVDEYQDAALIDDEIYTALPVKSRCYVGDPDQGIFGWRGGKPSILTRLFDNPTAWSKHKLQSNYRCRPQICAAANTLISHNKLRVPKSTLPATPGGWNNVSNQAFDDQASELCWLASALEQMPGGKTAAVLVRTNVLVDYFATGIAAAGVPIRRVVEIQQPSDWPLVKAAVAWMAAPECDLVAMEFLRVRCGHEGAEAIRLAAMKDGRTIHQHKGAPIHEHKLVIEFLVELDVCNESKERVLNALGHMDEPGAGRAELRAALDDWDLGHREEGEGVSVLTLHSGKGREFDWVFMPAMEEGALPSKQSLKNPLLLEEERRLCFVGFTRARERLRLSCARQRDGYKGLEDRQPSRFMAEAGL